MARYRALCVGVFVSAFWFAPAVDGCFAAVRVVFDRIGPTQTSLYISNADGI